VLTGITLFRQRYGTGRSAYLEPADASPLRTVPVSTPVDTGDAGAPETTDVAVAEPEYWNDHEKHIVRFRDFRYHDRYPLKPDGPVAAGDKTDGYFPHYEDSDLGYYEFAVTLPGALWTRVEWDETAWRLRGTDWELDDDGMLDSDNPCDMKVLVQIDGAPGWDDMTADEAVKLSGTSQPVQPVAAPVYWEDVANRSDVYDDDAGSHRPKKPVLYLFDYHDDHTARNYINPYKSSGSLAERGQYGDRIRLRVYFHYRPGSRTLETGEDTHDIPWRTPWVDTIRLYYKAPTFVMEHREMAY